MTRLLALAFALFVSAAFAEPVFPPGSRIGLTPPPGMTPSRSFQGFEDRARGAMLVVTELSVQSYAKVAQDLAPEQMQAGGMEEIAREKIPLSGGEGLLVIARQTENGVAMRKWALLALADDLTVVVIATMPEADALPDANAVAEAHAPADAVHAAELTPAADAHADMAATAAAADAAAEAACVGRTRGCD